MLERAQLEATRVRALVVALEQDEITLGEFSDAVESLTPEAMQVTASLLLDWNDLDSDEQNRLWEARQLCWNLASRARVLS